jgi:hypothetical protein
MHSSVHSKYLKPLLLKEPALSYGLTPSIAKQASTEADVPSNAKGDKKVKARSVFYQRFDMTPVKSRSVGRRRTENKPLSDFEVEVCSWKSLISRTECIIGHTRRSQHRRQRSIINSRVKSNRMLSLSVSKKSQVLFNAHSDEPAQPFMCKPQGLLNTSRNSSSLDRKSPKLTRQALPRLKESEVAAACSEPKQICLFISDFSPSVCDAEIKPPKITLTKKRTSSNLRRVRC